jgi:PAS domain S-box-containing protein
MRHKRSYPTPEISPLVPVMAGALAVAIFLVDALTSLDMAVAVLYVVVVLLAANFLDRRGLLLVSAGCAVLTVLAYLLAHGLTTSTAFGRFLMSLAAIGITAFLALRNQSASMGLREQARLPDLTHDTIFVRDMNDVITYWNRGAEDLYGWKREQAVGKASHQLTQTIFPAPLEEITAELLRTGRWEGELVHTKGDGTQVVVASRWSLQQDERGRPVAIMETNTNITERKEAEERLRKAERELRLTIDTIPAMVVSAWPDGTVDFINARWIEQGFSEDDLRAGLAALVHPDDLAEFAERRSRSIASGEPYQAEVRLKKANGEFRWYLAQAVTLRDETGRVVKRYSTATDIEDHKRAEESLRRAESELRTTIDSIPAMVLSTWPDGTMDFINARFAEEGFSEQDLLSDWSSLFHPEDLPELMERRQRSLAAGGSYEAEARVRRIDGEYRWFLLRALGLRDQTGRVIKRYVTATDIEDRKRAEDALRRSEALLAETQALSRTGSIGFDPATGEVF